MLTPAYAEVKRLRTSGDAVAAVSLLKATPPANETDAFEAVICLFVCGEISGTLQVANTYPWKTPWISQMVRSLHALLSGDAGAALPLARTAMNHANHANHTHGGTDAAAVFLIVLQANGQMEEATAYISRHYRTLPLGEPFLLTVMAEIAAAMEDWKRAYQLASAVLSLDAYDYRALMTLSLANFAVGNVHEALGSALRANHVRNATQPATLQIMRCHNKLGDYYSTIGAFTDLKAAGEQQGIAPDLHIELGVAWHALEKPDEAIAALNVAMAAGQRPIAALRLMLKIHVQAGNVPSLDALVGACEAEVHADIDCLLTLGLARLDRRDIPAATAYFEKAFELYRQQNGALAMLPWPVPEPRLRHDIEQLERLAQHGKLDAAGLDALAVLRRYGHQAKGLNDSLAPAGAEGNSLQRALTGIWSRPQLVLTGSALGDNDYGNIEQQYFDSRPALVVIDNFLSTEALKLLRQYCEEATVWKLNNERGYVGALLGQGFSSPVLLAIADQLKHALPRVIGDFPLLQAWGFKYDQRMQGINMHADFARINVNFWITPDDACADNTTGGMVVYDVPAPSSWTFADYNTDQLKMQAYLRVHNAKSLRVPYRANRCVLFDSSLIHITDELHFKPGYENRRVNVTLLYGRARSYG